MNLIPHRKSRLDWRDRLEIAWAVTWPLMIALVLGGFGFVIMVASQR